MCPSIADRSLVPKRFIEPTMLTHSPIELMSIRISDSSRKSSSCATERPHLVMQREGVLALLLSNVFR